MGRVILVANDDLFFGGRILSVLEKSGFRTVSAASAEKVFAMAGADVPSLAIVNLNSPRLGGIELIRRLREAHAALPILAFLSHSLIPPIKEQIYAAGASKLATNGAVSARLPVIVDNLLAGIDEGGLDECED